jgi:hypothetical protein
MPERHTVRAGLILTWGGATMKVHFRSVQLVDAIECGRQKRDAGRVR